MLCSSSGSPLCWINNIMPPLVQRVVLPNQYGHVRPSPRVCLSGCLSPANCSCHYCITAGTSLNCLDGRNWRGSLNHIMTTRPVQPRSLMSFSLARQSAEVEGSFIISQWSRELHPVPQGPTKVFPHVCRCRKKKKEPKKISINANRTLSLLSF